MNITHRSYRFAAVIERDVDGYFAYCPGLQACHAQGDTYEEAGANLKDVVQLVVDDMMECGEESRIHSAIRFNEPLGGRAFLTALNACNNSTQGRSGMPALQEIPKFLEPLNK